MIYFDFFAFFFSSRRRHTRYWRDWSSDVCSSDVLNKLERCKVIANGGVGVDRIDLDAATERGIVVTNVPDVFVEEVAVHAMMLLLACAKKVINLDRAVRENRWGEARSYLKPMPRVVGDTIGLIPFGNIPRL